MAIAISADSIRRTTQSIAQAAQRSGVDFSYLLGQARLESGLNPAARAPTSSARGLYQFIEQSWLATVKKHGGDNGLGDAAAAIQQGSDGRYFVADKPQRQAILNLRHDPDVAASMAAAFAADNRAYLEPRIGRAAESVDLYLAHFLGAAGAAKFLKAQAINGDSAAAPLFPRAASANRAIFYKRDGSPRSLTDIRARFAAKLAGEGAVADAKPMAVTNGMSVQPADYLRLANMATRDVDGISSWCPAHRAQAQMIYLNLAALLP